MDHLSQMGPDSSNPPSVSSRHGSPRISSSPDEDCDVIGSLSIDDDPFLDLSTPPPPPTLSPVSSIGTSGNPPTCRLGDTSLHQGVGIPSPRHRLLDRLELLARRLSSHEGDVDEVVLARQLDQLEMTFDGCQTPERLHLPFSPLASPFLPAGFRPASPEKSPGRYGNREQAPPRTAVSTRSGMTAMQARRVVSSIGQLNNDLATMVSNLRARQEETDHIQGLLIERAERAAQRIIFLQNRISYLESELRENDDELQYLRICLKAVEIQVPPHPDKELQRCIAAFKRDYQELKKRRSNRAGAPSAINVYTPSEHPSTS